MKIYTAKGCIEDCASAILVPHKAIEEAGYIQTLTDKNDASAKHEFHAMAQMAYFQFQDDELEVDNTSAAIHIVSGERTEVLESGLLLYRDAEGGFYAIIHQDLPKKKLLEAAYRFCTRWVRLDI
ncbi:MAG: hypothetical protein ABR512_03375 [Desulfopila sp.]